MKRRIAAGVATAVVVIGVWATGLFDYQLAHAGLNARTCGTNGLGMTFCGKQLEAMKRQQAKVEREQAKAARDAAAEERKIEAEKARMERRFARMQRQADEIARQAQVESDLAASEALQAADHAAAVASDGVREVQGAADQQQERECKLLYEDAAFGVSGTHPELERARTRYHELCP